MAGIAFDVDHLTIARRNHLAATDTAERTDGRRVGSAARFERRNRRSAAFLCQRADRDRAGGQSFEELPARGARPRSDFLHIAVSDRLEIVFIFLLHSSLRDWRISFFMHSKFSSGLF